MHAYRSLLPSETDDILFNSRDLIQPYKKSNIDLACSVCTVKYQTSVFCIYCILENFGLIFHSKYSRLVNIKLLLSIRTSDRCVNDIDNIFGMQQHFVLNIL